MNPPARPARPALLLYLTLAEDSLLAAPIILDLVILAELITRIQLRKDGEPAFHGFHPVAVLLSYLTKVGGWAYGGWQAGGLGACYVCHMHAAAGGRNRLRRRRPWAAPLPPATVRVGKCDVHQVGRPSFGAAHGQRAVPPGWAPRLSRKTGRPRSTRPFPAPARRRRRWCRPARRW